MTQGAKSPEALEAELAKTRSQLLLYAEDLRCLLNKQHEQLEDISAARQQIIAHTEELEESFRIEKRLSLALEQAHYETALRLTRAAECRGIEMRGHLSRIGQLASILARQLGASDEAIETLVAAAPLHDVGKVGVPDSILSKPGPLEKDEWELMKSHTTVGAQILAGSSSRLIRAGQVIALTHHERWDGSGYPQGLSGQEIPLFGRIVMMVDQYDALRSSRPYKPAFDHETTCRIILQGDGRTEPGHFDPNILRAFRNCEAEFAAVVDTEPTETAESAIA